MAIRLAEQVCGEEAQQLALVCVCESYWKIGI
jgi:hypothetical protein